MGTQGIALHRDLSSRFIPTALYHYPDEGNHFNSLQVIEHFLLKTILWFHENWGSFQNECSVTTTTMSSLPTTLDGNSNSAENGTYYTLSAKYLTASCILLGMHIFTL